MSEDFLTKGIENDRYLKAVKLINQFEDIVPKEIRKIFDDFVKESNLFIGNGSPDRRPNPTKYSGTLATHRIDYTMSQVEINKENPENLKLSVGLEFVKPAKQDEDVTSGETLSYVYYKVKDSTVENYEKVCGLTKNSDIRFGEGMWNNAPGIFYIPIENREDFRNGLKILREHFSKFGDEFGVEPK